MLPADYKGLSAFQMFALLRDGHHTGLDVDAFLSDDSTIYRFWLPDGLCFEVSEFYEDDEELQERLGPMYAVWEVTDPENQMQVHYNAARMQMLTEFLQAKVHQPTITNREAGK